MLYGVRYAGSGAELLSGFVSGQDGQSAGNDGDNRSNDGDSIPGETNCNMHGLAKCWCTERNKRRVGFALGGAFLGRYNDGNVQARGPHAMVSHSSMSRFCECQIVQNGIRLVVSRLSRQL